MADNTLVRYSGDWVFNGSGVLAAGALLYVYNEDTLTLATIYSDRDLGVTTANPVTADANGLMPFAYIGTQAYKVILRTSAGVLIDEEDDLPGALNTTPFSASTFAKPDTDVTSKTADYTLVEADLGGIFNGTCTGGTVQFTLLSAVTATNGRGFTIRHNGTANYVKIVSVSSQTISRPATGVTTTGFALVGYGESITLKSDGANWHVDAYVPPLISATVGLITVTDIVSSAPVSPDPGNRYIVGGAFSTFEQEDIIENDGQGNYIEYTPPADFGWLAYVRDENELYQMRGSAWAQLLTTAASQAEQETGTSLLKNVTPGTQHYHPSAAKAWGQLSLAAGTPTLNVNRNVTSVTDNAAGDFTFNFTTAFSSSSYAVLAVPSMHEQDVAPTARGMVAGPSAAAAPTTSALRIAVIGSNTANSAADPELLSVATFGDQ